MKLIEIDIVGLEPLQAPFHRLDKLRPALPPGKPSLRSQFIFERPMALVAIITLSRALREASQVPMMASVRALGLWLRRDGIDFRRVEDIDAAVERVVHLGVAFGFAVLLAEGHGAEGDARSLARRCGRALAIVHAASLNIGAAASWATWPPAPKTMIVDPTDKT